MRDLEIYEGPCVFQRVTPYPSFNFTQRSTNQWNINKARAELVRGDHLHPLPYHGYRRSFDPLPADYWDGDWHYFGTKGMNSPYNFIYTLFDAGLLSDTRATFNNRLLSNVADQELSYGVMLGELGESATLLAQVLTKLINAFRIARHPIKRVDKVLRKAEKRARNRALAKELGVSPKRALDSSLSLWLQYKFGWMPLMSDAYSLVEDIRTISERMDHMKTTVEAKVSTVLPKKQPYGYKSSVESIYEIKGAATFTVDDANLRYAQKHGLADPVGIAWELLGYSFIVDYFVSIGSFLGNLKATVGCSYSYGYTTTVLKEKGEITEDLHPRYVGKPPGWKVENFQFARVAESSFPKSQLQLKVPGFNQATVISAVALSRKA